MKKDRIYKKTLKKIPTFSFDERVASVFDNMVMRSIPFYKEILFLIGDIVKATHKAPIVYDLGCSTGNTIDYLAKKIPKATFIGIDNSAPMIKEATKKLSKISKKRIELLCNDITQIDFKKCDIVILNYTLQFLPLRKRGILLKKIYSAMNPGGIIITSEKLIAKDSQINELLIDLYHDFKIRNGYTKLEVAQKREALMNFLVPLTEEKQLRMFSRAGFKKSELIFRWYNFATYIGIK